MTYDRAALFRELERDEGLRLRVYRCTAGKLTIGIGRNLDDVGIRKLESRTLGITRASCIARGITRDQAVALFVSDIAEVEQDLDEHLPWWRNLDGVRQRVLLNMAFNLGIDGLLGFKNTLGYVKAGLYARAAANMKLSKWHGQVGARAVRLEAMMATGREP